MRLKKNIIALIFILPALVTLGQENKIWVSGAARAILYGDDYNTESEQDTTTARKLQSGHALVDLGVNIQPTENIHIMGMVRVRNDHGGFWGSGVTFDVRQLYVKGILGGFLKYQLGDIDYKLSDYTFKNNVGLVNRYEGVITSLPLEQIQYDLFYMDDHTWRQQGGAVDFALISDKGFEEMEFNLFTTRVQATDFAEQDDRLYSGGSIIIKQSKNLLLGGQAVKLYDFKGTSNSEIHLRNSVITGNAELRHEWDENILSLAFESGISNLHWEGDAESPELNDYFYDIGLKADLTRLGLVVGASYRDVGANFRSAGAQTMQINYARAPRAYQRIGNDKDLRHIGLLDLYRDASLYQTQIQEGLMSYDPRYDNATPYGIATPNRKGWKLDVMHIDQKKRWEVGLESEILSQVVGEGTSTLKSFSTNSLFARLNFDRFLSMGERKFWISARYGWQNTDRSADVTYEGVDLSTQFIVINMTATLFGDLDLIGEYRSWATNGFDLVAERNAYSEIIDFGEYNIDYSERIAGLGLQHRFNEKNILSLMWQRFDWKDLSLESLSYNIDTWTLIFTMKF
jgi:hypothetical protein